MTIRRIVASLLMVLIAVGGWGAQEAEREVMIKVNGMFCPFCTFGIEKRLKKLPETASVRTDLAAGEAIVTLKPGAEFVADHFADAIKRAGFSNAGVTLRSATESGANATAGSVGSLTEHEITYAGGTGFTHQRTIGVPGDRPGEFDQPMSIAFSLEGWFVVSDAGNARVQQFHPDGRPWRQWSVAGDGETPLVNPVGLAVGPAGDIWVSDYDADKINRYGPDGTPRGVFGQSGGGAGEIDAPSGLAVTPEGLLAVSDFFNHRVQLFTPTGEFVRSMGKKGILRGISRSGLNYPTRVTASPDGTLWVADAYNYRVVAFDQKGKLRRRFGKKGHKAGQFDVSAGIALLPGGRLAVADFSNHRIQVWTREGEFVGDYGVQGSGPGEFERPTDAKLAPDGLLYIVDWGNSRIQVLSTGE